MPFGFSIFAHHSIMYFSCLVIYPPPFGSHTPLINNHPANPERERNETKKGGSFLSFPEREREVKLRNFLVWFIMAELEKPERAVVNGNKEEEEEEEERLLDGMAALDFDMLCSTVALQTQGKWRKLESAEDCSEQGNADFGGVLRMWEGEVVLDFLDDRRVALESACCPCYRFGKNMKRAGFGYCFLQGTVYFIFVASAILNFLAFIATKRNCFLYLAVTFIISIGAYLGFFRTQIKRKFNIMGNDSLVDDCIYHLICPCCTLSQESRTLEMNHVQDGTWHGRGDICIGSYAEGSKAFFGLHPPPPPISIKTPEPCSMQNSLNDDDNA